MHVFAPDLGSLPQLYVRPPGVLAISHLYPSVSADASDPAAMRTALMLGQATGGQIDSWRIEAAPFQGRGIIHGKEVKGNEDRDEWVHISAWTTAKEHDPFDRADVANMVETRASLAGM